jgi:hypothetical protein
MSWIDTKRGEVAIDVPGKQAKLSWMQTLTAATHPHRGATVHSRQELLILYLDSSDLSRAITAWTYWSGSDPSAHRLRTDLHEPPYQTGIEALLDGWRLIKYPTLQSHDERDDGFAVDYFPNEFVFEKWSPSEA